MPDIHSFEPIWTNWVIDEEIGRGSFGTVWKAHREDAYTRITQYAAVKHISIPSDGDSNNIAGYSKETDRKIYRGQLNELVKEIKAMVELRGRPYIVAYEEHKIVEKAEGIGYDLFLRMELLTSLPNHTKKNGELGQDEVIKLGIHLAKALETLQSKKFIHRDIKPANIFIDAYGDYKLGDFGTARVLQTTGHASIRTGTLNYMAPEVYNGSTSYDQTVDIYSLGVLLYRYMNRGFLPFVSEEEMDHEAALIRRAKGEALPPPSQASEGLSRVILKACAYRPEDRYQTAREMWADLEALQQAPNPVPKTACEVRINCVLEDSQREIQSTIIVCPKGEDALIHAPQLPGYEVVGAGSVRIGMDAHGNSLRDHITFTYRIEQTMVSHSVVPIFCISDTGEQLYSGQAPIRAGETIWVDAPQVPGYMVEGAKRLSATLTTDGRCVPDKVIFSMRKTPPPPPPPRPSEDSDTHRHKETKQGSTSSWASGKLVLIVALVALLAVAYAWLGNPFGKKAPEDTGKPAVTPVAKVTEKVSATPKVEAVAKVDDPPAAIEGGITVIKDGFAGPVAVTVAFEKDGTTIKGIRIGDEHFKETEAFGARAKEPAFAQQFIGKKAPLTIGDIDGLSGATLTARAVRDAINEAQGTLSGKTTPPSPAPTPMAEPVVIGEGESGGYAYKLMNNGVEEYAEITQYKGDESTVTIPSELAGRPVRRIGDSAFEDCSEITSIRVSPGISTIGHFAFSGCSSLQTISLPDSLTSIGNYAFNGCKELSTVTIPSSVTYLGYNPFRWISKLNLNVSSKSPYFIKDGMLIERTKQHLIAYLLDEAECTVPDGVKSIGANAFDGKENVEIINMPETVNTIGDYAFANSRSLRSFFLPASVSSIGANPFNWINHNFHISSDNPFFIIEDGFLIEKATQHVISYMLDEISWTIPDGIKSVGAHTFSGNERLERLNIPASVTSIGDDAFFLTPNLKLTVTAGSYAEQYAKKNNIPYDLPEPSKPLVIRREEVSGDYKYKLLKNAGEEYVEITKYKGDESAVIIPSELDGRPVRRIGDSAFEDCSEITSIRVSPGISTIGTFAFFNCTSLQSISLPDSLTSIGDYAFHGCYKLSTVTIPSSVTYLGYNPFRWISKLNLNVSSKSPYFIKDGMLIERTTQHLIAYLLDEAECTVPDGVKSIGANAFADKGNVEIINMPETVTTIGDYAFANCHSLRSFFLPASVSSMGDNPFSWIDHNFHISSNNPFFIIEDGLLIEKATQRIISYILDETTCSIPDGIKSIGNHAFPGKENLYLINIPASVTSIGEYAFFLTPNLKLTVTAGSYAEQYAKKNNIPYDLPEPK